MNLEIQILEEVKPLPPIVFENDRKSLIQDCDIYILSGQKFVENAKNGSIWRFFENLKLVVKQCFQTGHFS